MPDFRGRKRNRFWCRPPRSHCATTYSSHIFANARIPTHGLLRAARLHTRARRTRTQGNTPPRDKTYADQRKLQSTRKTANGKQLKQAASTRQQHAPRKQSRTAQTLRACSENHSDMQATQRSNASAARPRHPNRDARDASNTKPTQHHIRRFSKHALATLGARTDRDIPARENSHVRLRAKLHPRAAF